MTDKKRERLAVLVAAGATVRDAVAEVGCSESTGYRMARTSDFQQRVAAIRSEVAQAVVGKLTDAATRAADCLVELLDDQQPASIRLQASKAILTHLQPLTELAELRDRVDALEQSRSLKVVR